MVQNLFNAHYYEYAVASAFTLGTFNAYPLPGRVAQLRVGAKW
jgi:iron complex outermembrane receptor protein